MTLGAPWNPSACTDAKGDFRLAAVLVSIMICNRHDGNSSTRCLTNLEPVCTQWVPDKPYPNRQLMPGISIGRTRPHLGLCVAVSDEWDAIRLPRRSLRQHLVCAKVWAGSYGRVFVRREYVMELNGYIDHTNLKQNATQADIERLCDEAAKYHFATVAINSCWTAMAAKRLAGTGVGVTTCIGFPLGACSTQAKAAEAAQAVADGTTDRHGGQWRSPRRWRRPVRHR